MKRLLETRAARRIKNVSKRGQRRLEEKNGERYKMVRFVEKRKICRRLKQCRAQLAALLASGESTIEGESEDVLRKKLAQLTDDKNYIEYFPLQFPYVSLFIKDPSPETLERRAELRALVHEAVAEKRKRIAERLERKQEPEKDDFFEIPNDDEAPPRAVQPAEEVSEKTRSEIRTERRWRLRMERKAREAASAVKRADTPSAFGAAEKSSITTTGLKGRCGGEKQSTPLAREGTQMHSAPVGERKNTRQRAKEEANTECAADAERRKKKKHTRESAIRTRAPDGERLKKTKKTIKGTGADDGNKKRATCVLDENGTTHYEGVSEVANVAAPKISKNTEHVTPATAVESTAEASRAPAGTGKKKQRVPCTEQTAPSDDHERATQLSHKENTRDQANKREGKSRTNKRRQDPSEMDDDEPTHPAWLAANTVQRRGCIIKEATNQRIVFDDDSD